MRDLHGSREPSNGGQAGSMSRRVFLRVTGVATGGLLVSITFPGCAADGGESDGGAGFSPQSDGVGIDLTPFFRVDADGGIIVFGPKIEMGQGTLTSLPMILADELDADWSRVRVVPARLDEATYGWQGVGGSTSIWESWEPLRVAAATAREMLMAAAAARAGVPVAELTTRDGRVHHESSGRSFEYGELAGDASVLSPPAAPRLKDPSEYRIIGTSQRQVGLELLVTGAVRYGMDTRAPGMLRASVERARAFGARPVAIDDGRALALAGVRNVIVLDAEIHPSILAHGVAVTATSTWAAMKGRQALDIVWSNGSAESSESLRDRFHDRIEQPLDVLRDDGDVSSSLRDASVRVDAEYSVPFVAHAPMEPGNCFADVRPDAVVLRGPLQDPAEAASIAASITGLPVSSIRVELPRLGGGFGRRLSSDYAAEAVQISMKAGAPVQVVWTREDDMRFDMYRPAALHRLSAGLDASGAIIGWRHRQVSTSRYGYQAPGRVPPERSEFYVDDLPAGLVPNFRLEYAPVESPVPRGPWRSVIHSGNAFVVQSFIDELAHAAGRDAVDFRMAMLASDRDLPYSDHGGPLLSTNRLRSVLELAAERSGWASAPPEGRARGVAAHFTFGGYAAQVVELSVADDGDVRVHRVTASIDCGTPVNPAGIRAQVEGCIVFGLTAALHGEITVEDGSIVQSNFNDYPLLRIDRMPEIEVHIVNSREPPKGTGEISVPPIMPAVANAVFAGTGVRLRNPPFTPARFAAARG